MPTYLALNLGYIKYSCKTRPGKVWSIQLGLSAAGTNLTTPAELFWNKRSLGKYFLGPGPGVTFGLGSHTSISGRLWNRIEESTVCLALIFLCPSFVNKTFVVKMCCENLWGKNKDNYFFWGSISLRREQSCSSLSLLTSRCWNSVKSRRYYRLCLNNSVTLLLWPFYSGNSVSSGRQVDFNIIFLYQMYQIILYRVYMPHPLFLYRVYTQLLRQGWAMCSMWGQSHRISLSLHHLRRLQGKWHSGKVGIRNSSPAPPLYRLPQLCCQIKQRQIRSE